MSDSRFPDRNGMTAVAARRADDACWLRFTRQRAGARSGDADAQCALGLLYLRSGGAPRDDALAARWIRRAADRGSARAQYALGVLAATGSGVPRDDTQAVRWLRHAAAQGHAGALLLLGYLYEAGRGVPADLVVAHVWWSLAAGLGDRQARRERDRLTAGMTLAQIARARALARVCVRGLAGPAG